MYIDVFEATCAGSLASGSIVGVWQLGAVSGMCAGSVAWLTDSCHVVKLRGAESCFRNRECTPLTTTIPPWERVVVGSPKSKRGANFKKGGSGYASRWRVEAGQSSHSGPMVGSDEVASVLPPAQVEMPVPGTETVVASTHESVLELVRPIGLAPELGAEYNTQKPPRERGVSSNVIADVVAISDVARSHAAEQPLVARTLGELPLIVELPSPDRDRRVLDVTTEEFVAEVIECDNDGATARDVARWVSAHEAVSREPRQRRSCSQSRASSAS